MPEKLKKGKIVPPPLRKLLAEQDKYSYLNQEKNLSNLKQRIIFVYGPLTKIWTAMEAEKEAYVAYEWKTNLLLKISNFFDQAILLLR